MAKVKKHKAGISDEKRAANAAKRKRMKRRDFIIMTLIMIVGCVFAWQFHKTHAFAVVSGISMEPTLYNGEVTYAVRPEEVEIGQVYVLTNPDTGERLVKRLVAMPGDVVNMDEGTLYVNGELSPYQFEGYFGEYEYEVQDNELYFLGDNRGVSADSRYWANPATMENVLFHVRYILFPFHKIGKVV